MTHKMQQHDYEANAITEKDEELIKVGIEKRDTESIVSSTKSHEETAEEDAKVPIDEASFAPSRTFYILRHNLFSKEVNIIDITSDPSVPAYAGGDIDDSLRDAARLLTKDDERAAKPAYRMLRKHFWSREHTMTDGGEPGAELATWWHPSLSCGKVEIAFPAGSAHSSHRVTMRHPHWYRRTNEWVHDSVAFSWRCDSRLKSNRMTMLRKEAGRQRVVARYSQRWGSWVTGGVLLVEVGAVDEVIAVLTACAMLRKMQQRAAERTKSHGGGGP